MKWLEVSIQVQKLSSPITGLSSTYDIRNRFMGDVLNYFGS